MGFPVSARLGKGGFFSCQSQQSGARPFQNCNSPLRKEKDVSYSDVMEAELPPPAQCKCVKARESRSSETESRQDPPLLLVEQEWIYISFVRCSGAGIRAKQRHLLHDRGNPKYFT